MAVVVVHGRYQLESETQPLNYGVEAEQAQAHVVDNGQFKAQEEVRMQFVQ